MDTTTQRKTPIPEDEKLPQIAQILDTDAMASFLARSLDRDESLDSVRIRYLRYRYGKNLVVHYEVEIDGVRRLAPSTAGGRALSKGAHPQRLPSPTRPSCRL